MAATITFRPKPGVLAALDALHDEGDRSFHINAALMEYLGLDGEDGEGGEPAAGAVKEHRPRAARQAVPVPAGEAPPCPHPKASIKKLGYGKQCTECGQMVQ